MSTMIDEALTAAGVPALVQKTIDPLLLEYQRRYSPFIRVVPTKKISSTTYYFNRRTYRAPGGFVTDGGARPVGNSVYEQFQFVIKLLQAQGGVTGFAQEVTRDQIGDLRAQEIASCMEGLLWDIEQAMFWGSAAATQNGPHPQFDGLDVMVSQFAATNANPQNAIELAGAALALRHLDLAIDMVETNASRPVDAGAGYMFVGSSTAWSRIAQLEGPYQRFLDKVEVAAGLNVASYRGVPLIKSSFLSSKLNQQMGTVVGTPAGTGGILAAGTYSYIIEPVVARSGTMVPSAAISVTNTGSTSANTLAFAVPQGMEGAAPQSYRVYRGAAGSETLLGIVDAVVGVMGDGMTPIYATSIVDTGSTLIPMQGATAPASPVAAYVGGSSAKPRIAGAEDIYLVPRDPDILLRPFVRDVRPLDVYPTQSSPDMLPFALATDTCLALRAPKWVGRIRNVVSTL